FFYRQCGVRSFLFACREMRFFLFRSDEDVIRLTFHLGYEFFLSLNRMKMLDYIPP
ncbi:hypothetical protein GIB67_026675, partial [Kingdonia uniflora]